MSQNFLAIDINSYQKHYWLLILKYLSPISLHKLFSSFPGFLLFNMNQSLHQTVFEYFLCDTEESLYITFKAFY